MTVKTVTKILSEVFIMDNAKKEVFAQQILAVVNENEDFCKAFVSYFSCDKQNNID